jgi:hypothetical protein
MTVTFDCDIDDENVAGGSDRHSLSLNHLRFAGNKQATSKNKERCGDESGSTPNFSAALLLI